MTPSAEEMFARADQLPQIPHVLQEVVASLRNEDVALADLADLVHNDPVISANVLRLANSSYYGASRRVASIHQAITLIGLTAFRNRVIAASLSCTFPRIGGVELADFWRGSMLVASLAHIIGQNLESDREMLFSAGLMHGIGQLLICLCRPDVAQILFDRSVGLEDQRYLELSLLQTSHFEVGMELARRWNFPGGIQSAIGHYDSPPEDNLPAQVVHVAFLIASGIQTGLPLSDLLLNIPPALLTRLHIDKAWLEEQGEVFDLLLDESAELVRTS
jgi:HD-like signal output (HDOD) protein